MAPRMGAEPGAHPSGPRRGRETGRSAATDWPGMPAHRHDPDPERVRPAARLRSVRKSGAGRPGLRTAGRIPSIRASADAAGTIAARTGIDDVRANLLPADKHRIIVAYFVVTILVDVVGVLLAAFGILGPLLTGLSEGNRARQPRLRSSR